MLLLLVVGCIDGVFWFVFIVLLVGSVKKKILCKVWGFLLSWGNLWIEWLGCDFDVWGLGVFWFLGYFEFYMLIFL